jgi:hypothetical protein
MPIKINVPFNQKDEAKKLGAVWIPDVKTWVISDSIENINPFKAWLPPGGGSIIKYPYLVGKSDRTCWKCHKETPLIAFGSKNYFTTAFNPPREVLWDKYDVPVFFQDIKSVDNDLVPVLKKHFPFFQDTYSKTLKKNVWVNTCIHCQTIQGDDYNFDNPGSPFYSLNGSFLQNRKTELLQLRFDYYLDAVINEGDYSYIDDGDGFRFYDGPTYQ